MNNFKNKLDTTLGFNLIVGSNFDYKTSLIAEELKKDPEVDVVVINPYDDIIEKLDVVINEMNQLLEQYSKTEEKPNNKTKWIVIDDYISCYMASDRFKIEKKILIILNKGRLINYKLVMGTRSEAVVSKQIRANMNIVNFNI